jgi:MFS family permease
VWALVADALPLYPLYALFFADTGLSDAEISALFALWSVVAIVAEVPSGAIADRWSRRGCLVTAGFLHAAGFTVWLLAPGFAGFAIGFAVWGLGGSLVSGAQEALLYDALAAVGEAGRYVRVQGRVAAAGLVAQVPAAGGATLLYTLGGYAAAGWVSVAVCLTGSALACRLPEAPRAAADRDGEPDAGCDPGADCGPGGGGEPGGTGGLGYLATLRAGVVEAATRPAVRGVLVAAALLGGLDAIDEYFPLITAGVGVETSLVAPVMLPIVLLGTVGATLGGRLSELRPAALTALLVAAMLLLGAAAFLAAPWGIAAVAAFYGLYRAVLVVVDARLQERITGQARATVTSVAGLGVELSGLAVFGVWAAGGATAVAAAWLAVSLLLPRRPARWTPPASRSP